MFGSFAKLHIEDSASTPDAFGREARKLAAQARPDDMRGITVALWTIEGLAGNVYRSRHTFDAPAIPAEVQPISHTGLGMVAVQDVGFDPQALRRVFEAQAHPTYRPFAYEAVGFALAGMEPGFMREFSGVAHNFAPGVPVLVDPPASSAAFVRSFPVGIQKLISGGYGRALIFKSAGFRNAIEDAKRRPFLDLPSTVQGIGFTYTLINAADLPSVFSGIDRVEPALRANFRAGVKYALQSNEWVRPGFLSALATRIDHPLIREAADEMKALRAAHIPFAPRIFPEGIPEAVRAAGGVGR
jgi:hypothetical protein